MEAMPRPRPPHLHRETTRHGTTVWYVRKGQGPRVRIKGAYGSPEFEAAYRAALNGETPVPARGAASGTLRWLIARYKESADWRALKGSTRRMRERILISMEKTSGNVAFRAIRRQHIQQGIDRRESRFAAANFLKTVRGLFRWAAGAGHMAEDPTIGVRRPPQATQGHIPWSEADFEAYETRWPLGTRERLALDLLAYTGARRGDLVQLGRQHLRRERRVIDGVERDVMMLRFRTEKTGTPVALPVLSVLARSIEATPCGDLAFLVTAKGTPFTKESFGMWFARACKAAGVTVRAHGIRKAAAQRAAYHGATEADLDAMMGWSGGKTAAYYIREANRERLAIRAAIGLAAEQTGDVYSRTLAPGAGMKPKDAVKSIR